ncbi:GNAT family N-acetyltransferase [Deinococcus frigens]|uniref:GNAT family N-acetyltransferase n=1 Tax=Deinococcus frigens TaxID=249403 RepID=UPI0005563BD9|nr:GNAT family protein [Deinococcus frigens]
MPDVDLCLLRPFESRDAGLIVEAGLGPLIPLITTAPARCDPPQAHEFIERQHSRLPSGAGYSLATESKETGQAAGQIGLWFRDRDQGRASLGYWLVNSRRGRGLASAALKTLADFGLSLPDIHRLELYVEPWNAGSWYVAERAGFRREGVLRSWQQVSDGRRGMLMYSLPPSDLRQAIHISRILLTS